jgi:hypothetical protein
LSIGTLSIAFFRFFPNLRNQVTLCFAIQIHSSIASIILFLYYLNILPINAREKRKERKSFFLKKK